MADVFKRLISFAQSLVDDNIVPGLGIALLNESDSWPNKYIQTFGIRQDNNGTKIPLDDNTVFQVASLSKFISATSYTWAKNKEGVKTPTTAIKNVTFSQQYVTDNMTIEDGLSHRSGLINNGPDILQLIGYNQETLKNALAYSPIENYRANFLYQNYMFSLAYEVGINNIEYLQDYFNAFNMNNTYTSYDTIKSLNNVCYPFYKKDNVWIQNILYNNDVILPAGGMASTLPDLMSVLDQHVNSLVDFTDNYTSRILSSQQIDGVYKPQPINGEYYGLGTAIFYRNITEDKNLMSTKLGPLHKYYGHAGAYISGNEHMLIVSPDLKFGIVVLSNAFVGVSYALSQAFLVGYITNDFDLAMKAYKILYEEIVNEIPPYPVPLTGNTINDPSLDGEYFSNFGQYVQIQTNNGITSIKLGNLEPTNLLLVDNNIVFTAYDIDNTPLNGWLQIINGQLVIKFIGNTKPDPNLNYLTIVYDKTVTKTTSNLYYLIPLVFIIFFTILLIAIVFSY
jgi:CubicO group peptidase (beta-lactamase class C family)